MAIFVSHGVMVQRDSSRISHSLMFDESEYIEYLKRSRHVSLQDALAGCGDALTFDDATYSALRGALIARSYGHPVTLFVNGWHVESSAAYFSFQLSALLDETRRVECRLLGRLWKLESDLDKRRLRRALKDVYLQIPDWEGIVRLVAKVSEELGVCGMEHDLCTLGREDVLEAVSAGVCLENHGWTHLNPLLSSSLQLRDDMLLNSRWIKELTGKSPALYAPPFGKLGKYTANQSKNVLVVGLDIENNTVVARQQLEILSRSLGGTAKASGCGTAHLYSDVDTGTRVPPDPDIRPLPVLWR